ncbi:hypothetical protein MMC25_006429 [Agyrium rufum]|nr:hypothetical protein [Agyrium rufum]
MSSSTAFRSTPAISMMSTQLKRQLDKAEAEVDALTTELNEADEERELANERIAELGAEKDDLWDQLSTAQDQYLRLQARLRQVEDITTDVVAEYDAVRDENRLLAAELDLSASHLRDSQGQLHESQNDLRQSQRSLRHSQKKVEDLLRFVAHLGDEHNLSPAKLGELLEADRTKRTIRIEALQTRIDTLKTKKERLQRALEAATAPQPAVVEEEQSRVVLARARTEVSRLSNQLKKARQRELRQAYHAETLNGHYKTLGDDLEEEKGKSAALRRQLELGKEQEVQRLGFTFGLQMPDSHSVGSDRMALRRSGRIAKRETKRKLEDAFETIENASQVVEKSSSSPRHGFKRQKVTLDLSAEELDTIKCVLGDRLPSK